MLACYCVCSLVAFVNSVGLTRCMFYLFCDYWYVLVLFGDGVCCLCLTVVLCWFVGAFGFRFTVWVSCAGCLVYASCAVLCWWCCFCGLLVGCLVPVCLVVRCGGLIVCSACWFGVLVCCLIWLGLVCCVGRYTCGFGVVLLPGAVARR